MNKKLILTTAVLLCAATGVGVVIMSQDNKTAVVKTASPIIKTSYADKATGDFSKINILYALNINGYEEKEFVLTNDNDALDINVRNDAVANNPRYRVSYTIHNDNKKSPSIEIQNNHLSFKQFNAFEKISIKSENQTIFQDIALDWSGKIKLKIPTPSNNICIAINDNTTQICHSFIKNGGQSS